MYDGDIEIDTDLFIISENLYSKLYSDQPCGGSDGALISAWSFLFWTEILLDISLSFVLLSEKRSS